ncbi:hypothetical protein Belba_0964 [Belliella baltica DSM 15883]|uniref:Uncharacterized protein n=1 Tax=Belliella baltica (strain DSM 15883 / CIP 108006 / LMG 21964 / BA134) TaxID=866536 RepID=I3Z2Y9_BELBD|nr:hypothetical protein [Belliella baltica]AFL83607.1 hypothetical protein Belba_0964 [Belliella baltica DSM 15883]
MQQLISVPSLNPNPKPLIDILIITDGFPNDKIPDNYPQQKENTHTLRRLSTVDRF